MLEGLVSTVAEEGLMAGLEDAVKSAAGSAAEQAAALAEASEQQRTAHFTLDRNLSTLREALQAEVERSEVWVH